MERSDVTAVQAGEGLPASTPGPPLVVVVSTRTTEVLHQIMAAGWAGPVLVVGTVDEAQRVVDGQVADGRSVDRGSHGPAGTFGPRASPPRGMELDHNRQLLVCGHRECALTPLEFGVLDALVEQVGEVRRFADLTRRVWGSAHVGDGGQVHAVVRRVRRKLELVRAPFDLLAVRGVGFRLVARATPAPTRLVVAE